MSKGGAIRWTPEQLAEFEARSRRATVPAKPGTPANRLMTRDEQDQYADETVSKINAKFGLDIPTFAPQAAKDNAKARLQALGRLRDGSMNKTEEAFDQYLAALQHDGKILWRKFEGIKLKLADKTHLTVDFAVLTSDGRLQMVDVKGAKAIVQEDAKVKMKVAAEIYPFEFFFAFPKKSKDGGGWVLEAI